MFPQSPSCESLCGKAGDYSRSIASRRPGDLDRSRFHASTRTSKCRFWKRYGKHFYAPTSTSKPAFRWPGNLNRGGLYASGQTSQLILGRLGDLNRRGGYVTGWIALHRTDSSVFANQSHLEDRGVLGSSGAHIPKSRADQNQRSENGQLNWHLESVARLWSLLV
jgi:hypothetical protein